MSRETILIIVGFLVLVSPFVGLPLHILAWILPVLGALVLGLGLGIAMRSRRRREARTPQALPAEPDASF